MCGICGIVSPAEGELQARVSGMVSVTHHRGPDASGTFTDQISESTVLALGHNRLSIVDLTDHAAQPMRSRDGRYVLVYNGEVYNYKELAQDLGSDEFGDVDFGDTAVVLAALIKWGPQALSRFNGMWAILLYDSHEKTLLVSRDRFGVKPLYYYQQGKSLYFASEVKAILRASGARLPVNPHAAVPYLTRGLLNFSDATFFEGIRQFAPASYQLIDLSSPESFRYEPVRYWSHPFELGEEPVRGRITPEEIRSTFLDSIRLRLRSDVPVGILLSGGVDSSAILGGVAALGALSGLTVLSVTSDDPASNEEPFIDIMSRHVGLVPQKINVSKEPMGLLSRLEEANWFNDEPVCGIADIAYLRLMERARERGIKVLLSGQGADEQLGGYNKFFYFWLMNLAKDGRYLEAIKTFLRSARNSNTIYEFKLSEAIRYLSKRKLSGGTFIAPGCQDRDSVDIGLGGSYIRREWIDLTMTSVPCLLHYEDRMSMSQSVEVRVPFLDYRLVEMLARVHPSEKFEGGWTKSIFRKAIEGLVPREIQYRRDKRGFNVPEDRWMRHEFKEATLAMFSAPMLAEDFGLIDRAQLLKLYQQFLSGSGILNARHFQRVYIFEMFLRRFEQHLASPQQSAA
ncbi:MAG: asparagine synthase (glutamine-hydrolyzing) [Thermoanaerobaculia bacterium]